MNKIRAIHIALVVFFAFSACAGMFLGISTAAVADCCNAPHAP